MNIEFAFTIYEQLKKQAEPKIPLREGFEKKKKVWKFP